MYTLYKLNFSSGKNYIGQTTRLLKTRITAHKASARRGSLLSVHEAWRTHGDPEVEVIGEFDSHDELHAAEINAIRQYRTLVPNGYNLSAGGDTAPSKNPEVAKKISDKAKGRKVSQECKKILSDRSRKNWLDPEYREKVLSRVKESWTDEARKAKSESSKAAWAKRKAEGWIMPESHKEKLRGRTFSEETRKKMSAAAAGKKKPERTAETREKLSAATAKAWENEAHSKSRSHAIRNAWTPEKRASFAEKVRARHAAKKLNSELNN